MYAFQLDGNVRLRTNAALREYARLEYPREDVHWLLATAKPAARPKRTVPRFPRFTRRAARAPRPVACKGTPRRSPEGTTSC